MAARQKNTEKAATDIKNGRKFFKTVSLVPLEFKPRSMRLYGQKIPIPSLLNNTPRTLPISPIPTGMEKLRIFIERNNWRQQIGTAPRVPLKIQIMISGGQTPGRPAS